MLNIHIHSFPHAKGVPIPTHDNGCGFVFDCRGIENPGLLPELVSQPGLDAKIEDYLLRETKIDDFLTSIESSESVNKYLERGFTDLGINIPHNNIYLVFVFG